MVTEIIVRISEKGVAKLKNLSNLQESLERIQRRGDNVDRSLTRVNKRIDKLTGGTREITNQFKQFKFELLGVLFFGMGVSNFIQQMVRPTLELVGVFDILTFTLHNFFLPTAEDVAVATEVIGEKIDEIPDPISRVIGWILLLVGAIGKGIFWFAVWALGLDSLRRRFPKLFPNISKFFKWIIRLIVGVKLLTFFKKSWSKIMSKLVVLVIVIDLSQCLI